jgi:23S rRNA (adenine2030-N6)-methyltransferase
MNYRHGYHAGNFADVVKHLALITILQHLQKKDAAFAVIDSHAGRGLYDLAGEQAGKTNEARGGIARLQGLTGGLPAALETYLALVKESGSSHYPGSPLLAAKLLRPQDRLTAIEKHPEEFAALKDVLSPFRNAAAEQGDGYARTAKLLPPPSRRGLVLIDPPFEAADEFQALAQTLSAALRKFATGIFLVWYPVKSQAAAEAFIGEVLAGGAERVSLVDTQISAPSGKLDRAALLVINPPYGFEAAMFASADIVAPLLAADIAVRRLAGAE